MRTRIGGGLPDDQVPDSGVWGAGEACERSLAGAWPRKPFLYVKEEFTATSFGPTGSISAWEVPASADYLIDAYGAQGGGNDDDGGGLGAHCEGIFFLEVGDILHVLVGTRGLRGSGEGIPGGGGTFVAVEDPESPHTLSGVGPVRLLLAAGGGGGTLGNDGGTSADGRVPGNTNGDTTGTDTTNARGGASFSQDGTDGAMSFLSGGQGGTLVTSGGFGGGNGTSGVDSRRGGGGGYEGGNASETGSAEGGGSYNDGSSPENESGVRTGNGLVTVNAL